MDTPTLNLEVPTFSPKATAAEAMEAVAWLKALCAVIDPAIKQLGARAWEHGAIAQKHMGLFDRALEDSVAGNAVWALEDYAERLTSGDDAAADEWLAPARFADAAE